MVRELRDCRKRPWRGGSASAIGTCTLGGFSLSKVPWIGGVVPFFSPYGPQARGVFTAMTSETRIECRIGLSRWVVAFVLCFGGGFLFVSLYTLWYLLSGAAHGTDMDPASSWIALLVAAGLLGFPVALAFVRWIDSRDVDFLKRFVAESLQAERSGGTPEPNEHTTSWREEVRPIG